MAGTGGKAIASDDPTYLAFFGGKAENVPNRDSLGYCADEYAGNGIINWLHVSSACAASRLMTLSVALMRRSPERSLHGNASTAKVVLDL